MRAEYCILLKKMGCVKLPYRSEERSPLRVSWKGNRTENRSKGAYRFKYNGKELQSDLDLNWYDYGARMYDAALGRWHVVDPMADKYPTLTPYNYVANNPLLFVDPDGNELQVTFENDEAKKLYTDIINSVLGGQFNVNLTALKDKDGKETGSYKVGIEATENGGDINSLSKGAQSFVKNFQKITEHEEVVKMDIVFDDSNTTIGNFDSQKMDIADVAQFPKFDGTKDEQNGATQAGKIIHETAEQFNKALGGKKLNSHERAISYENSTNGNTRLNDSVAGANQGVIESFQLKNGSVVRYQIIGGQYSTKRGTIIVKPIKKK